MMYYLVFEKKLVKIGDGVYLFDFGGIYLKGIIDIIRIFFLGKVGK